MVKERTHVWSAQPRIAVFLAVMRHSTQGLRAAGRTLHYTRLDDDGNCGTLTGERSAAIERLQPAGLVMTAPGDWCVLQALRTVAGAHGLVQDHETRPAQNLRMKMRVRNLERPLAAERAAIRGQAARIRDNGRTP